jgi:hypothetical protein
MGGPLRGHCVWVLNGSLVVAAALILTVGTQTGTAHALEVSFLTARGCLCVCVCVCDCVCVCGLIVCGSAVCERLSSRNVPFCSDALSCCAAKTARTRAWCCDHSQMRGNCAHDSWLCVVACTHPSPRMSTTRQRKKNDTSAQCLVQPLSQQARGQTLVSWRGMRVSCCSLICSRIECSLDLRMEGCFVVLADSIHCAASACVCV